MSEPLSLTVLGSDGSYPGPAGDRGACSGYLLRCAGRGVWLDAGPGTLANLQAGPGLDSADAVVISHRHIDHWSDLEHLAVAAKYVLGRSGIALYCEQETFDEMTRRSPDIGDVFVHHAVGPGAATGIGPMTLSFFRTDHPVPTLAVRVDAGGRSLGYSADTGPGWEMSELGPGVDLALCEASYMSDREAAGLPHLSARQAGGQARAAGAGRLVITHIWATVDRAAATAEAQAAFGRPVRAARIGERYEI